jgi:hypothetical protein
VSMSWRKMPINTRQAGVGNTVQPVVLILCDSQNAFNKLELAQAIVAGTGKPHRGIGAFLEFRRHIRRAQVAAPL